jgi:hypothetical protein
MNMIYNSPHFCVVEFGAHDATGAPASPPGATEAAGGFEIMNKTLRREIFLRGRDAEQFRAGVQALIQTEPSADEVDEFLERYSGLMTQPLSVH